MQGEHSYAYCVNQVLSDCGIVRNIPDATWGTLPHIAQSVGDALKVIDIDILDVVLYNHVMGRPRGSLDAAMRLEIKVVQLTTIAGDVTVHDRAWLAVCVPGRHLIALSRIKSSMVPFGDHLRSVSAWRYC
jgi:hypothetical protein